MKMQKMQRERRMTVIHQNLEITFGELTSEFIDEQRAKGNAAVTIKHYEQSILKFKIHYAALHSVINRQNRA